MMMMMMMMTMMMLMMMMMMMMMMIIMILILVSCLQNKISMKSRYPHLFRKWDRRFSGMSAMAVGHAFI